MYQVIFGILTSLLTVNRRTLSASPYSLGAQFLALGFRQSQNCHKDECIGAGCENANGRLERNRTAEIPDQRRKQCADRTAEIIAESHSRSAETGRIQFGKKRSESC